MKIEKNLGSIKVGIKYIFQFPMLTEDLFLILSTGAGEFKVRVNEKTLKELKEFLEDFLKKYNEIKEFEIKLKKEQIIKLDSHALEKIHKKAVETLKECVHLLPKPPKIPSEEKINKNKKEG